MIRLESLRQDLGLTAFDARGFAAGVDVPTAVVVTAEDRLIRPVRQRELAAAIPGAHVVEVEGAHNAWLVRPREFSEATDEALSRVTAPWSSGLAPR